MNGGGGAGAGRFVPADDLLCASCCRPPRDFETGLPRPLRSSCTAVVAASSLSPLGFSPADPAGVGSSSSAPDESGSRVRSRVVPSLGGDSPRVVVSRDDPPYATSNAPVSIEGRAERASASSSEPDRDPYASAA